MKVSKGCIIEMTVNGYSRYSNDTERIFEWISFITSDVELSIDASSWCEIATVGDVYSNPYFILSIVLDD